MGFTQSLTRDAQARSFCILFYLRQGGFLHLTKSAPEEEDSYTPIHHACMPAGSGGGAFFGGGPLDPETLPGPCGGACMTAGPPSSGGGAFAEGGGSFACSCGGACGLPAEKAAAWGGGNLYCGDSGGDPYALCAWSYASLGGPLNLLTAGISFGACPFGAPGGALMMTGPCAVPGGDLYTGSGGGGAFTGDCDGKAPGAPGGAFIGTPPPPGVGGGALLGGCPESPCVACCGACPFITGGGDFTVGVPPGKGGGAFARGPAGPTSLTSIGAAW